MFSEKSSFFAPSPRINPYASKSMAEGYDRPSVLYKTVIDTIKHDLGLEKPVPIALDVGCGTGISSQALKEIASYVIGVDPAREMLEQSKPDPRIDYQKGSAEHLSFRDNTFELVTACVAFHFFNKEMFFKEAGRVLKENGHLIICYTNFTGLNTKEFDTWKKDVFRKKYPPTPGTRRVLPESLLNPEFPAYSEKKVTLSTEVDIESLAQLLMTMSGPGEAMQKEGTQPDEMRHWLLEQIQPFFTEKKCIPFYWDITIWTLQRALTHENDDVSEKTMRPASY